MHIHHFLLPLLLATPAAAQAAPGRPVSAVAGGTKAPAVAAKLEARLVDAGFADGDVVFTPVVESGYLTLRYPGRDPKAKPVVVLGHLDLSEARASNGTGERFVPVFEGGYLFGRRASHGDGDTSVFLAALLKLRGDGWKPDRDVIVALSGDRRTRTTMKAALAKRIKGAQRVLDADSDGAQLGPDAVPVIFTLMVRAGKFAKYSLTVTDPGHNSPPPAKKEATATLAAVVARIGAYRFPVQLSPLSKAFWLASAWMRTGALADAMRAFAADPGNAAAAETLSAEGYTDDLRTICEPEMVARDQSPNKLLQWPKATVSCRIFPGAPESEIRARLIEIVADPAVTIARADPPETPRPYAAAMPNADGKPPITTYGRGVAEWEAVLKVLAS
jgi:acetylornithine deacetylase/succinyl-diaminopimelate desuccinylase-like protein